MHSFDVSGVEGTVESACKRGGGGAGSGEGQVVGWGAWLWEQEDPEQHEGEHHASSCFVSLRGLGISRDQEAK